MKIIKFEVEGIFNSFKIPVFKTYHKTFLSPPKTAIIGMIANILDRGERYFYEELQTIIDVSVIIKDIQGSVKDLWSYKTFDNKNHGKSIIRRERNFMSQYTIYLKVNDLNVFENIYNSLLNPKKIPSLGQDDEVIKISGVEIIEINKTTENTINSIFEVKEAINFKMRKILDSNKFAFYPTIHNIYTKFNIPYNSQTDKKNKREYRKYCQQKYIAEFFNGNVEVNGEIDIYKDEKTNLNISFY